MFYFVVVSVGIGCVNVPYCLGFRDISAISINVLNSAVVGGNSWTILAVHAHCFFNVFW